MKSMEELKKLYNNVQDQDRDFFIQQYHHFRNIMTSKNTTLMEITDEFDEFTKSYFRCKVIESDITLFKATMLEFQMRINYGQF